MIKSYLEHTPEVHPAACVAETAAVIGRVHLAPGANIWYGTALRGDVNEIYVGEGSNIQENSVCHTGSTHPLRIGKHVTVGHAAILHGCTIGDGSLIGMGAILLDGCVIGAGSMVAAGALVTQNTVIPDGCVAMGSPAKAVRPIRPQEAEAQLGYAIHYRERAEILFPGPGVGAKQQ